MQVLSIFANSNNPAIQEEIKDKITTLIYQETSDDIVLQFFFYPGKGKLDREILNNSNAFIVIGKQPANILRQDCTQLNLETKIFELNAATKEENHQQIQTCIQYLSSQKNKVTFQITENKAVSLLQINSSLRSDIIVNLPGEIKVIVSQKQPKDASLLWIPASDLPYIIKVMEILGTKEVQLVPK